MKRQHHPLVQSLIELKGNPRACVYCEPLWGIAYNLYAPFATLYMAHLGVSDEQIGLLLTIGMAVQIVTSLLGGILIDKIGRRRSALILGLLSWSIPPALLMLSKNFWWFFTATVFNGFSMIEAVAWNCLLVEDAEPDKLVDMYNWVTISGLLAVFFAPLAGLMVKTLSLVTAMRILYAFAFFMMTTKTVVLYFWSNETKHGLVRMKETRDFSYLDMLKQYRAVFKKVLYNQATVQVLVIIVLIHITNLITNNFFALFATQKAGVPDWLISIFPIVRSAVMLVFFFGVQHRLSAYPITRVMMVGLFFYLGAIGFLMMSPVFGPVMLSGYVLLDAMAYALVWPRRNSLLILNIDPHERARAYGIVYALMIAAASPFGWLAGWLSEINRAYPFILNGLLYVACIVAIFWSRALSEALSDQISQ